MGCGASAAQKKAPFLAEYFKQLGLMMDVSKDIDPMSLMLKPGEAQRIQTQQDAFKPKLTAAIEKSFGNHDQNKDGALSTEEAKVFFQNYIDLFFEFHEKHDVEMVKAQVAMAGKMANQFAVMLDRAQKKELNANMKQAAAQAVEQVKTNLKAKREDYKANKEQKDAEAFKVIDVSADGQVQRQELVEAFQFQSEKNVQLHLALGLLAPDEVEAALAQVNAAGQIGEGDADCNMQ